MNSLHSSASGDAIHLRFDGEFYKGKNASLIYENQAITHAFVCVAMFLSHFFVFYKCTTTVQNINKTRPRTVSNRFEFTEQSKQAPAYVNKLTTKSKFKFKLDVPLLAQEVN